jgi:hypothetical protein
MQLSVSDPPGIPAGNVHLELPKPRAQPADYTPQAPVEQRNQPPERTVATGVACDCLAGSCFNAYDRDGDGCLSAAECALQAPLGAENCTSSAWDQDGDGCINGTTEWPHIFNTYNGEVCPVEAPPDEFVECPEGHYLNGRSECEACINGATRRRRSFECSTCPTGTFDAGHSDDCLCGLFTTQNHSRGGTTLHISSADGFHVDDRLIVSGEVNGTTEWDSVVISAIAGRWSQGSWVNELTLADGLRSDFPKYSSVRIQCTITDGSDLSYKYRSSQCGVEVKQCGCGAVACSHTTKCDLTDPLLPGGTCRELEHYPEFPTPAPTVGAKGDPHLVNLAGEHFDINHGGKFMLLRLPQAAEQAADVEINAVVTPEWGRPCITYITQVELSGKWLNGKRVQVRCFLRERAETNETEAGQDGQFLGIRTLGHDDMEDQVPWISMTDFPEESHLAHPDSDVEVKLIKTEWFPKSQKKVEGNPGVAGQFQFNLKDKRNSDAAKVVVRQDLPGQEHLNMAVRRLSVLGRADVGGLLGFDSHSSELERVTKECAQWRSENHFDIQALPDRDAETTSWPRWKRKWQKIREERKHKAAQEAAGMPGGDAMKDNEAGASLQSRDIDDRDVYEDVYEDRDSLEDQYAEAGLACMCPADSTVFSEGVLTERMSALFAEATWD